jgi:glucose/arabinose dehydrogenase
MKNVLKRKMPAICAALLFAFLAAAGARAAETPPSEGDYYKLATLPIPKGVVLEASALQLMPDRRLAVATRIGEIYMVENPFAENLDEVKFRLYASGLHEILGLTIRDGWLYCVQRCEVTRMKDTKGTGRADVFETVAAPWGINGDYHEYAFGSKFDPEGNIWTVLCLTGSFTSENSFRGWSLRVSHDGKVTPTCSGIRSPGGIGTNHLGDVFYTDNQGPWNGACALKHLQPGTFQGNPQGNKWYKLTDALGPQPADPQSGSRMHIEAKKIPQLMPPPVIFPYRKMGQSASGIATDFSAGKFGPFQNQMFVGDQTHSTVMRVHLEKVNGRYQGACFPFRAGFDSGCLSIEMTADGAMFVGGTDRGWGARGGKPFALQRLTWTGKKPFEISEMRAKPDGFEFAFSQPVERGAGSSPSSYAIETYTYIYQSSYGSPEVDGTKPTIKSATVAPDGLSVRVVVDGLQEGHVHEFHLPGVRSAQGQPLVHDAAYYTLNQIPK